MKYPYKRVEGVYSEELHPVDISVYQSLTPLSTANITLPEDEEIAVLDMVKIPTPDGKEEEYRVSSVTTDAQTNQKSVYLEHSACTLGDQTIPEETKKTDTIANILTYILSLQTEWTVGTVDATQTIYVDIGGTTLMDAITEMMSQIPAYKCLFVNDGEGWHVDIVERQQDPVCEARLSRNMRSCSIASSAQSLCTRVVCEGITDGHMDSPNIDTYGVFEETMALDDSMTKAQKEAVCRAYLEQHDHPALSISISGLELSEVTGLSLDRFDVGSVCRLAIPWLGITINETIIEKRYSSLIDDPQTVTFSLANATPDLSIAVAQNRKSGKSGAKKYVMDHNRWATKFEQTDQYFRFLATDSEWEQMGEDWAQHITAYSQIVQTAGNIQLLVTKTGINNLGENETLYSQIDLNAQAISLETTQRTQAVNGVRTDLTGLINVQAGKISMVVEEKNGQNVVKAASIVSAINDSGSEVVITADHIELNGDTIASLLYGKQIEVEVINGSIADFDALDVEESLYVNGTLTAVGSSTFQDVDIQDGLTVDSITLDGVTLDNIVVNASVANNTLTLTKLDGTTINFSKATALTDEWRGSEGSQVLVVTATPQGNEYTYTPTMRLQAASPVSTSFTAELVTLNDMAQATVRRSLNGYLVAGTVPGSTTPCVNVCRSSDGSGVIATFPISGQAPTSIVRESYSTVAKTVTVKATDGTTDILTGQVISAAEIYNAGWHNAYGKISLPSAQTSSATMTVRLPGATQDTPSGLGNPYPYTVSCDDTYCYIKDEDDAVVARTANSYALDSITLGAPAGASADYDGRTITNGSGYYYLASEGTGSTGSGAEAFIVVRANATRNGTSISNYYSRAFTQGPTNIYRHAYQQGYNNALFDDIVVSAPNGASADYQGTTITNGDGGDNYCYIAAEGTGSTGSGAEAFIVIRANAQKNDSKFGDYYYRAMTLGPTNVYRHGYQQGYANSRTAILNALSVRAGGWTWDSEEEEYYNTVTAYNGSSATSAVTTLSLPQITSSASIVYNASRHEYAYNSSATSGGHAIASSAAQWSGTQAYEDGWAAATGKVVWPSAGTTAGFAVKAPSSTVGSDLSKSFTLSADGWTDNSSKNTINVYMGGTTVATTTVNAPSVSGTLTTASSLPSGKTATTLRSGYLYKLEVKRGSTTISTVYYRCP